MRRVTKDGRTYVVRGAQLIEIVDIPVHGVDAKAIKAKHGRRHMGALWAFWVALSKTNVPWLAVVLGIYIYRRTQVTRNSTVTLASAELEELGINRYQRSRALRWLVSVGIIQVNRTGAGRSLRVTLLLH
jgi:hypothetical protein